MVRQAIPKMSSHDGVRVSQEFFCPFVLTNFCRELTAMCLAASGRGTLLRFASKKILLWQTRQEPAASASVVSVSGVGVATASTGEAQPIALCPW